MKLVISFLISLSICAAIVSGVNYASADGGSGSALLGSAALPDAGSASAPAAEKPADKLHDALSPTAALDDAKQAQRQGWPVFAFALGVILAKTLAALGKKKNLKLLSRLNAGRTAVAIGGFAAFAMAGYNALADGGSIYAGFYAGGIAIASWWNSHAGGTETA